MKIISDIFERTISPENLLESWREFLCGKRGRSDVACHSLRLADELLCLKNELTRRTYRHGGYESFLVNDGKPRTIHKACVRDRVLHHAVYRLLYPLFDRFFIGDSFSCRRGKGTHAALNRFNVMFLKESRNNTRQCWVLKCDIRKFFASIDHAVLLETLERRIEDRDMMWLLREIISSFHTAEAPHTGLPLGNLTSQLFANVYLNEFDQFMKHELKVRFFIRYADDFAILSHDREYLLALEMCIGRFLQERLRLRLRDDTRRVTTFGSGIDFLGWVHFPDHRVLRPATCSRMRRRMEESPYPETFTSYLGMLQHGNARKLERDITRLYLLHRDFPV